MREIWIGMGAVLLYFLVAASGALLLRKYVYIEDEVFRKSLHFILLGSLLVWVLAFSTWWHAALTAVVFALAVYPFLHLAERIEGYSQFVTERKSGELKSSLLIVFGMFAVVVCVCWGWFGDKLLVLAAVYAWGFGDAAAALVGKRFGRHALTGKHIEGRKSVEGSLAMFAVSFLCIIAILLLRGGLPWYSFVLIAAVTAAVTALVELYSLNGMDTITCPFAATAVMLPLLYLLGGGI
ncbi:MAG: phosphatidate cytidylyltransferase [Clostridia bacterium]|nr:phosphatidate cytidylyltransferase [Clostridia bacterium]